MVNTIYKYIDVNIFYIEMGKPFRPRASQRERHTRLHQQPIAPTQIPLSDVRVFAPTPKLYMVEVDQFIEPDTFHAKIVEVLPDAKTWVYDPKRPELLFFVSVPEFLNRRKTLSKIEQAVRQLL